MRSLAHPAPALLLLLALTRPGLAQEDQITRQRFTFLGSSLTVEIQTEAPGALRLVHGQSGQIEVAARADAGIASFGLAGDDRDELVLTALAADRVAYIVIVPENVRVRVKLPDRPVAEVFGSLAGSATYAWTTVGDDALGRPRPGSVEPRDRAPEPRRVAATGARTRLDD